MSLKADLDALLNDAVDKLHAVDELAVSERNRVHEAIQGAQSAVASMVAPDEKPQPAAQAAQEPAPAAPVAEAESHPVAFTNVPASAGTFEAKVVETPKPDAPAD